jgi:hypothetical protein
VVEEQLAECTESKVQMGETSPLRNQREVGSSRSYPGTLGLRNVKPPEDLLHGIRTQVQSSECQA